MENRVVVKFTRDLSVQGQAARTGIPALDARLARVGATRLQAAFPFLAGRALKHATELGRVYYLQLSGKVPLETALSLLRQDPLVAYAEPVYVYALDEAPNDSLFPLMGQFNQVKAVQAWDVVKGEQGNVIIAVVDGGTDWDHQDLLANVWTNPGEIPNNGLDDDNNGFVDDVHGWNFANNSNDPTGLPATPGSAAHGTHVAGTAAAVTNNGLGVASISWNCRLMPINAAHPTLDRAIAFGYDGIVYATANGASVVNCSWGGPGAPSRFEQEVIDFAHDNGTLVVAAAGNGGDDNVGDNNDFLPHFPASYHHVLAVGATQQTSDFKAGFSNFGVTVDVFAPGVGIYSTTPNNTYSSFFSGTSMASPLAAGLAGLVKTLKPAWNVDQVREQVRVSSDPIDAFNPGQSGLLGKGRINALRAVSDFSLPAVRIARVSFVDAGGDGIINAGETVDLTVTLTNFLASASGITASLSSPDNAVTVTSGASNISALNSGDSLDAAFQFKVANGTGDGAVLHFYLDIAAANGYNDRDFFTLVVNPPQFATHNTGTLQTSITTQGNIGFVDFAGSDGDGFVFRGRNYLFEGGLMIGRSVNEISDCVRGADGQTQDTDFRPATGELLQIVSPGANSFEEGSILLVDSLAATPLGVTVLQESFADTAQGFDTFVIFRYTIQNNSNLPLSNLFVGLFFDWDIRADVNDFARWDGVRRLGYAADAGSNPANLAGVKLLSQQGAVNFRAIDNPALLYDGFTNIEKWNFLSGGIQTQSLNGVDVSLLLAEGPLNIPPGQSAVVGFAVLGANSLAELEAGADFAQSLWDSITTDIEPLPAQRAPERFQLAQNYPNPFNPETVIAYSLPVASAVKLVVYDALGREIRTLVQQNQPAGQYRVRWDGRDEQGRPVPSGVYFYRLQAGRFSASRKMLLLK
ncbi:MAG: T9SS C-terminal target domain-containing protein [Calditrichaeota bacterium]|nr:MAG: T9SS C-terminal target domain-containing protein [Calditrichota bacterium]